MITADLSGKTALVTGGASGIGLATVEAFKAARGAICSTASIAGVQGSGSSIPYATSKAGVINLTRSLARTLAPEIRVNAVAPGFVDSPWNKDWPADRKQQSIEHTPL